MKQKLLVALAVSGLLVSPMVLAADMDSMDDGSGLQNLAMDNTTSNATAAMQNAGGMEFGNMASSSSASADASAPAAAAAAPNANDDMSADTATGDDDY